MSDRRDTPAAEREASRAAPWVAAALSLALAVALTWPAALRPSAVLIGHPGNDVWNHAWGYAWVADSLARGALPRHTDLLAWPDGGSLYFIDTAVAVALAPVTWTLGAAVAYNLAMIGGIAGSCLAAWLLGRRVCGASWPAALTAVIYGASPHLLGQAYNGISETVAAWGFPLALWATLRLLDRPGPRAAALLGAAGAAAALVSWYGGVFAAIGAIVLAVDRAARAPREAARALPWAAAAALVAAVAVAPALWTFRETLSAPDALVTRDLDFVTASLTQHNLTDALAMVRPGRTPSPDLRALFGEDLVIVVYVGLVALLAAGLGVLRARPREAAPWVALGLVFFVLSLGPYLYIDGQHPTFDGRKIPLPFLPLFDGLPLLSRVSHPFRFVTGLSLAVGALAALGLARVSRPGARQAALSVTLGGLALLEVGLASPATLPVPCSDAAIPRASQALRGGRGAVLDLPMSLPNLERAVYLWYQTAHGRPVPWGLNEPMPASLLENRLTATLLHIEAGAGGALPPTLPVLDLELAARALAAQGLGHLVVHEALYPPDKRAAVLALLTGLLGPPVREARDAVSVYPLDPAVGLN